MNKRLRMARDARGWSQSELLGQLERVAGRRGLTLSGRNTLKSLLSRWENGRTRPDEFYRSLLREVFGMDDAELGFPEQLTIGVPAPVQLRLQLTLDRSATQPLVDSLVAQAEALRVQDRTYGAPTLLEQLRALVASIEFHLQHGVFDEDRRRLARVLADAAALAGWQALDVGAYDQAWRSFETATLAAREAEDMSLWAFARSEQAHVLVELGSLSEAAEVSQSVWDRVESNVGPAMRCWLAASQAEMRALVGDDLGARAFLSTAEGLSDALDRPLPPYLVFDRSHLERWIGHTLTLLGDGESIPRLRRVIAGMDSSFSRASASLRIDLATALFRAGESKEAAEHLRIGEELATQIGSRRQLSRIEELQASLG